MSRHDNHLKSASFEEQKCHVVEASVIEQTISFSADPTSPVPPVTRMVFVAKDGAGFIEW